MRLLETLRIAPAVALGTLVALLTEGTGYGQSCQSPAPYQGAYLQFMLFPDLPQGSYDLLEISVLPKEWRSSQELLNDGDPATDHKFRMLALYYDMRDSSGVYANAYGNVRMHNDSGYLPGGDACTIQFISPSTRTYSTTLIHDRADLGYISESIPAPPFFANFSGGEGPNQIWNTFDPSATDTPMYPEGEELVMRVERVGSGTGVLGYPLGPLCTTTTQTGDYTRWEISVGTAFNGARNLLGEHRIFTQRGESIWYSRAVQFEVFQADCLSASPIELVIDSIRARDTQGNWATIKSGSISFWQYGIGAGSTWATPSADCTTVRSVSYDYRFGAYANNGKLHLVVGHANDERYQKCGPISWAADRSVSPVVRRRPPSRTLQPRF
jgi:hypothetical protein